MKNLIFWRGMIPDLVGIFLAWFDVTNTFEICPPTAKAVPVIVGHTEAEDTYRHPVRMIQPHIAASTR